MAFLFLSIVILVVMIFPLLPISTFAQTDVQKILLPPSFQNLMGTDSLGRDLLFQVFVAAKVSLEIGLVSAFISILIGILWGGWAAILSKRFLLLERIMIRLSEILMSIPNLVLSAIIYLMLTVSFGSSLNVALILILALGLSSWMPASRFVYNLAKAEMKKDYIQGARAIGATQGRILRNHILPNLFSSLVVYWSLQIPHALLAEASLSFLGFGVRSPQVSLGLLLEAGWKTFGSFPHLLLMPTLFFALTVFSINILLEKMRRKIDPKLRF